MFGELLPRAGHSVGTIPFYTPNHPVRPVLRLPPSNRKEGQRAGRELLSELNADGLPPHQLPLRGNWEENAEQPRLFCGEHVQTMSK